ncbi:MAG: transposase [Woronichinia naegeliana WA131]|uniref:Transposase n=1 Tax=Woronichinia naegeliana WA131 TaxID=2824559 RepID=A0A977L2U7_9CYAN|nr:MAG: transposase [Woronichinia naegeliana WA131]
MEKETGILLGNTQLRNMLKKKRFVYIWAKYSLEDKKDEQKREEFRKKVEEYKKLLKEKPESIQIWFWDESGFSLRVIRRKHWTKKGKRKKVRGDRRKGRVNVMGGIRYTDKKRWVDLIPTGNSQNFKSVLLKFYKDIQTGQCEVLGKSTSLLGFQPPTSFTPLPDSQSLKGFQCKAFRHFVKMSDRELRTLQIQREWIEQGNKKEDFEKNGALPLSVCNVILRVKAS